MVGGGKDRRHTWSLQALAKIRAQRSQVLHGLCTYAPPLTMLHPPWGFVCEPCAGAADPLRYSCLPPKIDVLLGWSSLFRSEGTFANYLGHVRTCCLLCRVSDKLRALLTCAGHFHDSGCHRSLTIQR